MTHGNGDGNDHHKSCREIELELDDTRASIDERARELRDRLDPREIADALLRTLPWRSVSAFFDNLGRGVRDNPLPVLLTGVGIAWLARSSSQDDVDDGDNGYSSSSSSTGQGLRDKARGAGEAMRSGAQSARRKAGNVRRRASRQGEELRNRVQDGAERVQDGWNRMVKEQPLALGVLGIAAGAALGALLPSSRREDELMGSKSDEVKEKAAEQGHRAAEHVREKVEEKTSSARSASSTSTGGPGSFGGTSSARPSGTSSGTT